MIPKWKQEDVQAQAKQMEAKKKRETSIQGQCLRGNPRIFRVSPSFGGKDRHSKVCTIKGLRDRRIRLSAQTAIQVYDLQTKLGLNQPSKVIDWLIDVTRFEIDKLPPLHFPKDFHPNAQILHQSSMILPQVCHFDAAMKAKNDENDRLLLQKFPPLHNYASLSNDMDGNCCHFEPSSFPFPLMEANPSPPQFLFCPLMSSSSEVSSFLPTGRN